MYAIKSVFKNTSEIKINATKAISISYSCSWFYNLLPGLVIWWCCTFSHLLINILLFFDLFQSMIGHCLGAAGGLEAIATVKAITTGWLHPTINQFVRSTFFFVLFSYSNLCLNMSSAEDCPMIYIPVCIVELFTRILNTYL